MMNNNFCWIATWKITDRCNLNCAYCDPTIMKRADASETFDRFEVVDRIGAFKPRVLNISGGEPALVKELPLLLSRAKENWEPHIRVVHNGTMPGKLEGALPYIDRLVISIDGPGEINAATRGISGDAVLEKIARLIESRGSDLSSFPDICVNTVVTEGNIGALIAFASQIESISPRILLALLPVMPLESELSILRNRDEGYGRFIDVYTKMTAAHPRTVHNFDCVMRHKDWRRIMCYNQYFTIRFSPRGELFTCGAGLGSQLLRKDNAIGKIFKKGGLRKAFTMITRAAKSRVGKVDFTCRNMCNCESWLDMLLLGADTGYAPTALRGLRGRLSNGDYKELDDFVRSNINPEFDIDWFRDMVEVDK